MTVELSTGLQLVSTVKSGGELELRLRSSDIPKPGPEEVLIRVEAAPINPSDLGLLFGPADLTQLESSEDETGPVVTGPIPQGLMKGLAARTDHPMAPGNEGAGTVIEAGSSDAAQAIRGRTVAAMGGSMYSQYRCVPASNCLILPEGTLPKEAASCFVNPLTVLNMLETMRMEGHKALIHTAAASNLGQMLNRVCLQEGVELVNVVRKPEQKDLLMKNGAKHVCDSSSSNFRGDLTDAIAEAGATLAFDATGGGNLPDQIMSSMEAAANRTSKEFSRYGSSTHKQLYIYGGLDRTSTQLNRNYGMAWGIGGWLLPLFMSRVTPDVRAKQREKVATEIKTTFASRYTAEVSLTEALSLDAIAQYGKQATGEKYLINPNKNSS